MRILFFGRGGMMFGLHTKQETLPFTEQDFWRVMEKLDWQHEGNDEKVLKPLIRYLAGQTDAVLFAFEERMAELLYRIDGEPWGVSMGNPDSLTFADEFLYARCVALVNGQAHYQRVWEEQRLLAPELEFESLLYVAELAWERKHPGLDYPYITQMSYETFSNQAAWTGKNPEQRPQEAE